MDTKSLASDDSEALSASKIEQAISGGSITAISAHVAEGGRNVAVGKNITFVQTTNVYQYTTAEPVTKELLQAAQAQLAKLPLDHVPTIAPPDRQIV